jgi:hypothetical protein
MQVIITTLIFGLPSGQRTVHLCLTLPGNRLSLGELIAHKIRQEVAECQSNRRPGLTGEYLPPATLIGARTPDVLAPGDAATEIIRAQQAFAVRDYMIVIDNQRIDDLDTVITLSPCSRIEFIKILPLVGG